MTMPDALGSRLTAGGELAGKDYVRQVGKVVW